MFTDDLSMDGLSLAINQEQGSGFTNDLINHDRILKKIGIFVEGLNQRSNAHGFRSIQSVCAVCDTGIMFRCKEVQPFLNGFLDFVYHFIIIIGRRT